MTWGLFQRICEKNSKNYIEKLFLGLVFQQTLNTTQSGVVMTPHYFNLCTGWLRVVRFVETSYPQPVWHHRHVLFYDMHIAPTKRVLQTVESSSSSFKFQYLLVPLRPSSSCLHFLPLLPVLYIFSLCFSFNNVFRRPILCKIWPIKLIVLHFIVECLCPVEIRYCHAPDGTRTPTPQSPACNLVKVYMRELIQENRNNAGACEIFHVKHCNHTAPRIIGFTELIFTSVAQSQIQICLEAWTVLALYLAGQTDNQDPTDHSQVQLPTAARCKSLGNQLSSSCLQTLTGNQFFLLDSCQKRERQQDQTIAVRCLCLLAIITSRNNTNVSCCCTKLEKTRRQQTFGNTKREKQVVGFLCDDHIRLLCY